MTLAAHAKVNLTLKITGVRPDGFHELESIVQPIGLHDEISIEPAADGVYRSDTGFPDDLCLKAARVLGRGVAIRVVKRIPVGGGLGGGSADAAAVLRGVNELYSLGYSPERLAELGAAVGSDVPALVLAQHYRGPVMMSGRGERVALIEPAECAWAGRPLADWLDRELVLLNPGIHSSTPDVYRRFDELKSAAVDFSGFRNDLEPAALALYPGIGEALSALRRAGLEEVMMSGSGSTVFGFIPRGSSVGALPPSSLRTSLSFRAEARDAENAGTGQERQ